jgi:acyl carrier protein
MDINGFLKNFADQFEKTDPGEIMPSTNFKNLKEWGSLVALSVMAMADEEYNVKLTGDDVRNSSTVEDLFIIVNARL